MGNSKKIVITPHLELYPDQIQRLRSLGEVVFYDSLPSPEEWIERVKGADIICSGKAGLIDKIYDTKNVFYSLPFVNVGWIDKEKLKANNIVVSYCPGCNKEAVSEWVMAMLLNLFRELPKFIKADNLPKGKVPRATLGLRGKRVTILGKGNIGGRVAELCEVFGMNIEYFKKGDSLIDSVKNADVIINCLSSNGSTWSILDRKFFRSLKKGSYFISPTDEKIYDVDALIEVLDAGILAGAADDAGGIRVGDTSDTYYQKLLAHPKILVTPHIAYQTDITNRVANDMMIENIEAYLKGKPINLL